MEDLEIAVAEYVDGFNHRRLHSRIGLTRPRSTRTTTTVTTPPPHPSERQFKSLH
jgi:putative transposase